MHIKGLYRQKPVWFQVFVLLILVLAGTIAANIIGLGSFFLCYGFSADIYKHIDFLRFYQFLSALGTFLLPSIGAAWLFGDNNKQYLFIGKIPSLKMLLSALAAFLLLLPAINITEIINSQITFPEFMSPVEQWMKSREESALRLTSLFLSQEGLASLLANIFVIAIIAGVGEEFFFRGVLQSIIGKWSPNPHLTIWIVAILFSAIHFQFYGFIPRMLLGAFFGYLLLWSRNMWVPVFIHFINNAFAVLVFSINPLKDNTFMAEGMNDEKFIPYTILAVVFALFFCLAGKQLRRKLKDN